VAPKLSTSAQTPPVPLVVPELPAAQPTVEEMDHTFVPPPKPHTTTPELHMEGEIVVVGQRQKKRKRDRNAKIKTQTASSTSTSTGAEGPEGADEAGTEIEPFNYDSAPNILDESAALLDDGRGKKRKLGKREGRGALFQYGDFPAPPRNPTDVASGNRSHTFK
jgi:exosome complex exonuclease RRP6